MLYFLLLIFSFSTFADNSSDFLNSHNNWRIKLNSGQLENQPIPTPAVPLMEWNLELANDAQDYANNCIFKHSTDRNGIGENLAMGHWSIENAVDAWVSEYEDYIYPNGFSSITGHYTQVVWNNSTQLGCGYAPECKMYVCLYRKQGNFNNQPPYKILSNIEIQAYTDDMTLDNVLFNGEYYQLKMKSFVLYDFRLAEFNSLKSTNYVSILDGDYILYVPFVFVGGIEYFAILRYDIETVTFTLLDSDVIR